MKIKLVFIIVAIISIVSCKKDAATDSPHALGSYRVSLIGKAGDTTTTPTKSARVETTGLDSTQDSRLKAILLAYDGHGGYTVQVTNLQSCQVIIRWGWEGLTIDSISPGGSQGDVIAANQTKIFKLIGAAKVGKIKLQAQGNCGNSSTLIINITTSILPISYTNYTVTYNPDLKKTFIAFSVEHPGTINWIIIEQLIDKTYKQILMLPGDDVTTIYNIKLP